MLKAFILLAVCIYYGASGYYFQAKARQLYGDLGENYGDEPWYQVIHYVIRDTHDETQRKALKKLQKQMVLSNWLVGM